jgi:ABC-2 type transport system permease protein
MKSLIYHFAFEFRAGIRLKQLLLMNYLFPLGFYLLMGFIMEKVNPQFKEVMIPAMIIFAILAATLMGIPIALASARENGIFRSYQINGVPVISILSIPILTTTLHLLLVAVMITFSAPFLFDALIPENWSNFMLIFIVTTINCSSISVLIGVVSSSVRATILWSQLIFVTSTLLGGLMVPYQMLPDAARNIAKLLPATHAMNAINSLAMGKSMDFSSWGSVLVLLSGSLLSFTLAFFLFSWDEQNETRRCHPLVSILAFLPFAASIFIFS